MKTRLTPEELARAHDGLCVVSIGDGECSCLVHWVEALQKEADDAKLKLEADGNYKAAKYAQGRVDELLEVVKKLEVRVAYMDRQIMELIEAGKAALEEFKAGNPYDRRDVRFPSQVEVKFRHAITQAQWLVGSENKDERVAICGWCAGTGKEERAGGVCPKCGGAGGKAKT